MPSAHFSDFANIIKTHSLNDLCQSELLKIAQSGNLGSYYTPFDSINLDAKIVLVGICPGRAQWVKALTACKDALDADLDSTEVLKRAKATGAFSGPIRTNLIQILDHIGLQDKLNIDSCAALFASQSNLVHMTSVLGQSIFVDGANYAGSSPKMLKHPFLLEHIHDYFIKEVKQLPNAVYIPLGQSVIEVLYYVSSLGYLQESQILDGFPHPSGANAERIQYFLGNKPAEALSCKTNPTKIDQAKQILLSKLASIQL